MPSRSITVKWSISVSSSSRERRTRVPLALQWLDQLEQAADIVDLGGTGRLVGFRGDQGAHAVAGEKLFQ